jgi:hypothetical protein
VKVKKKLYFKKITQVNIYQWSVQRRRLEQIFINQENLDYNVIVLIVQVYNNNHNFQFDR